MRRSRTLVMAAAIVMAGMMALTLSPPQGTDAQWRDTDTAPVTGPKSDTFNMTASNVDFPAPPWPSSGRVSNSPRVDVTNESARHSSWVNVHSTSVKKTVTPDSNNILSQMALDYEYGEGKCELPLGNYWKARVVGQITENTPYPRTQNKVAIGTLAPGQKRSLCPAVRLNYETSTPAGQRDALLNHAGRALDITTVVNQKSELPATWASEPRTAISRYRINMPAPKKPSDGPICRNTTAGGNPGTTDQSRGGFFWGWPDAGTNYTSQKPTPAMAGGWELFRKSATGDVWQSMHSDVVPDYKRHRGGIPGNVISNDGQAASMVRQFKARGYPFTKANGAPDKSRYVESSWIAEAHMAPNNTFICDNPVSPQEPIPNPNAGPHNMP